jgi:hypothetical protein
VSRLTTVYRNFCRGLSADAKSQTPAESAVNRKVKLEQPRPTMHDSIIAGPAGQAAPLQGLLYGSTVPMEWDSDTVTECVLCNEKDDWKLEMT